MVCHGEVKNRNHRGDHNDRVNRGGAEVLVASERCHEVLRACVYLRRARCGDARAQGRHAEISVSRLEANYLAFRRQGCAEGWSELGGECNWLAIGGAGRRCRKAQAGDEWLCCKRDGI